MIHLKSAAYRVQFGKLLLFLFLFMALNGCAMNIAVQETDVPVSNQAILSKIPLSVGIIYHDENEQKESVWQNPQVAANVVTVSVPTGKILNKYSYKVFNNLFDKTILLKSNTDNQAVDAILSTEITDIHQSWVTSSGPGGKYQFTTSVNTILTDKKGIRIWEKVVRPQKNSSGSFFVSIDEALMGKVVTESAIEALQATAKEMRSSREIHAFADTKNGIQPNSSLANAPTIDTATKIQAVTSHSDIDTSIPTGKPAGKYDVAVVIGNANYSATGTPNVDFALQDAQAMKQYLTRTFGYDPANIIYIENATLAKMYEVFGTDSDYRGKLYKWVKPGQSRIFIYYVGHGAPDQQTGEGYFVPVDANPQYISTSGYKLSTFYENLSKIPAAKKTIVIDACFSGSSANGQLLKGVSGLTARLKSEPKASVAADLLLTSAGMDQVSGWYPEKGHSLFTYFFLKGIQGEADTNKDGRITMAEMKAWLNDQVPYMARRLTGNEQQPVIMGKDGDELVNLTR